MPDATITSTASTFGTISGTFSSDQSTVTGTISGVITGTLTGSVGVPGPAGPAGIGIPSGGLEGQVLLKASDTSYDTAWYDNYAATLQATVRNETGATLSKGTVVYISGGAGNKPLVTKASASSESSSSKTFAILAQDIPNNQNGQAVTMGLLKGLDTTAFTAGANLWLSTTAGQIVSPLPPASPAHAVFLGNVVRVHANQGEIEVRIQNGLELGELHDVLLDTPANGQVLKYDSAQGLWINGNALTSVAWGDISGTLSNQTDLQTALNGKYSTSNPAGYITSSALTGYATESWVTSQGYLTSSSLTPYLTKADNLGSLTNFATARSNLSLGTLDTPVFAGVTAQGSGSNVANLTPTSLTLTHTTSGSFVIQPSSGITFPDSSVQTTAFTTAQLSAYLAKASNLSDLPSASTARTNLGLGSLAVVNDAPSDGNQYARKNGAWDVVSAGTSYISSVSSPLSVTSGNLTIDLSAYLTTSAAASTYRALSNNTFGGISTNNIDVTAGNFLRINDGGIYTDETLIQNKGLLIRDGATITPIARFESDQVLIPSVGITFSDATVQTTAGLSASTAASTYQTIAGMSSYLTTASAASTYQTISGMSSYLTTASAASTYAPLAGATFTGLVNTAASTTTTAGLRLPHGAAPSTPVNGDLFTTTSGLFARINGTTRQYVDLDGTQTINGTKTFSGANQTLGNSTAAGTINIGTGATISGSTRTINIGTASAAGSTNAINIGGGSGTSTTTLQGSTVGVTLAADTNTTGLATTAFVVGQAGSATPLVNGTAAVGTSLRYARQDHVHPTDTSRAALAGATFTGLVSTPASATGGAGFRIVPGVAPTTPTNGDLWATTTDLQVRLNGVTETLAEQSWVTSQGYITSAALSSYAPLASPTFTGTVTIPAGASISGYATTASLSSYAPLASPALTGTPTAPTAAVDTNTTQVATTAYVVGQGYLKSATASSTYAPLASPALTGTPTAPTATAGTSTTQLATTAFVTTADNLKANLASPAFTGTPTAPTATAGTNTTQIATTAFVTAAIPTNNVKAWVNFNGSGTISIRGSFNVSSITDNAVGDYTVNFTTALADINYTAVASGSLNDTSAAFTIGFPFSRQSTPFITAPTTTAARFAFGSGTNIANALDPQYANIIILR